MKWLEVFALYIIAPRSSRRRNQECFVLKAKTRWYQAFHLKKFPTLECMYTRFRNWLKNEPVWILEWT